MSFIRLAGFIADSIEREQRRKQSRCELCGQDKGSELILLEEWRYRSKRDMIVADDNQGVAKRLIYRGDEAREKINPEKPKQCPTCGAADIKYAYIEDGTMGYWCYQCKKSLKAMKGQLYKRWHPYDREFYIVCPSCAVTDIPSPPAAIEIQIPKAAKSVIVTISFVMFLSLPLYLFITNTNKKITREDGRLVSYNNGLLDTKKGKYEKAISDFTKAIEKDPKFADAYYNRGFAYFKKGQFDQAISDYNMALEIDPKYTMAYKNRGNAYYNLGKKERACNDWTKACELGNCKGFNWGKQEGICQ